MRYGVLADIHGNLPALEAAVSLLRGRKIDRFVVAGDLVGYGPFPNECVARVRELDAVCVAGNHDLIALGRLSDARCIALARETLKWTRGVLDEEAHGYLAGLPLHATIEGRIVVAHGSLDDPEEYVTNRKGACRQLRRLHDGWPAAQILVLGHTHRARVWDGPAARRRAHYRRIALGSGSLLLNPGAVGQSRSFRPVARCMLLDLDVGEATFYSLKYDISACRRGLVRAHLPPDACHLRPSPRRRFKRVARRSVRRLLRGRR